MTEANSTRPAVGKIRSNEEHADLLTYHLQQIRTAQAETEAPKAEVDAAREKLSAAQEEVTKRFNAAKADLGRGYSREYMQSLIDDGRQRITSLVDFERMRARDKGVLNQPVFGLQPELFPGDETPTAARDEMAWEAEGYQRGLRGALEEILDGDPPEFRQAIMRGFEQGQKVAGERFVRAQAAIKARENPDAGAKPKDLNAAPEPEPGTPEAKAKERKSIAKAKESLEKMGSDEKPADDFEASPEELAAQTTRAAVVDAKNGATSGEPTPAAVH